MINFANHYFGMFVSKTVFVGCFVYDILKILMFLTIFSLMSIYHLRKA